MDFEVLLVDDDSIALFLHKVLVERSNLPPASGSFKNGKEALDFMSDNGIKHTPCLVLLDINMPVMSGWDFLDAIQEKEYNENVYVAMVTSSINVQDAEHAKKYPQVIDYLVKPIKKETCDKLLTKMEQLLT